MDEQLTRVPAHASSPIKWALPLAALLVLGVAIAIVMSRYTGSAGAPSDSIRGSEILPIAPLGNADDAEFRWQSPAFFPRYRVTVFRGSSIVWQTDTQVAHVTPPIDAIPMTVALRWIVEGIDREGVVRMTSPSQSLTWLPPER